MDNKKIIKKIKGLLAIAQDSKSDNDEESQAAFVLAQKLMIQNNIDRSEVENCELNAALIGEESVTVYKKLYWWEKMLAVIIGENFRVKTFMSSEFVNGSKQRKSKIVFYGLKSDLEIASEMFILAYDAVVFYSNKHVDEMYDSKHLNRSKHITSTLKSSYIRGFLDGLNSKFNEQRAELLKEYSLVTLIPDEVEDAFQKRSDEFSGRATVNAPDSSRNYESYYAGEQKAQDMDFLRKTIDE